MTQVEVALLVAAMGLVGVLVAGAAGAVGAFLGARIAASATRQAAEIAEAEARAAREDAMRARFADTKRVIYGDFYAATQRAGLDIVTRLHATAEVFHRVRSASDVPPPADLAEVFRLRNGVTLLASDRVETAANRLITALAVLGDQSAVDPREVTSDPWEAGDATALWDAHTEFLNAAREDLGIPGEPRAD